MERADSVIPDYVLPASEKLEHARSALCKTLPTEGLGTEQLKQHLTKDICPGLNQASQSSRYYGFVIGGATPAAKYADNLVTEYDQNVQVHVPKETICTEVEFSALNMLCELLDLCPADWAHKTFPTGATAANIIGLACGREHIIAQAGAKRGVDASVAELGLIKAMRVAEIDDVQILTTVPHSSIRKAASVIGLGHASIKEVAQKDVHHRFDRASLEKALQAPRTASIIMVSASEVNTGLFATNGLEEFQWLRQLADKHGAWIHVDAAFGLLCRALPDTQEFAHLRQAVAGIELADSITGDAHKLLNVPYDTGILLSRHLSTGTTVFQNPGAPYLTSAISSSGSNATPVPSPLMIGLENSRRFRALPVYANLVAYGRTGLADMLARQIRLARQIAAFVRAHPAYELLAAGAGGGAEQRFEDVFIIVLFRARDDRINGELVRRINGGRRIYVSGTSWGGRPACRFAVSNWMADAEQDLEVIKDVLEEVVAQ
ncbi:hypothetical protein MBLNU459_g2680t1 [Dothideomycetes sp. NU459]